MKRLTVGSLFSGIGGFELGLENTGGFVTKWQVELHPYARRVLKKNWPTTWRHDDVRTFPPKTWKPDHWAVDVICGGFPCQDVSNAGKRRGITAPRSGLWTEFARVIGVVRPKIVLVENVPGLLHRGMGTVLGSLASIGYDAEWECLPASAFGAPHFRYRVFIIAYSDGCRQQAQNSEQEVLPRWNVPHRCSQRMAEFNARCTAWGSEPGICRVDDGVPDWVDRIACLGNAVAPPVAEFIGELILERLSEHEQRPQVGGSV